MTRRLVTSASLALLCSGCLYVSPAWRPEPNDPPQILIPTPTDEDIPLVMDRDVRVTVVARDPENERLDFVWIVPVDVEHDWTTSPEGDLWYSVLDLPVDPVLDGRRVELVISDGIDEVGLTWLVEVPQ